MDSWGTILKLGKVPDADVTQLLWCSTSRTIVLEKLKSTDTPVQHVLDVDFWKDRGDLCTCNMSDKKLK